jgi:hypothetical protein
MIHRTSRFFFAVICLLALPSYIKAQTIEGTITMQMASPMLGSQKVDIVYSVKGDKVLQTADDPKVGKISVYTDNKTGTQIIVQEAQKQGMEIDQVVMDDAIKSMHMPDLVPKATGKKDIVKGYNCELYTLMMDSVQEMDIWLTKDLPKDLWVAIRNCTVAGMKNTGVKSDALMNLFQSGYAQVRMEMKYNGVTQLTNEFLKAEQKKLDDSIFTVPADITVTKFDPQHMNPGVEGK